MRLSAQAEKVLGLVLVYRGFGNFDRNPGVVAVQFTGGTSGVENSVSLDQIKCGPWGLSWLVRVIYDSDQILGH
jgi:hypothetical protein